MITVTTREATNIDVAAILEIYNQGIMDRIATLETEPKDLPYMNQWFQDHQARYSILVAERAGVVIGWASLNPYSHRCAYNGVSDLSVYVDREYRGKGVGSALLSAIEAKAIQHDFRKIVLFTLPFNAQGQGLYNKKGYRKVGVFEKQGVIGNHLIDVVIMEKVLLK
ncbi:N-acetyltransferase family protein [Paenibacillus anaericanus]|uniref:N-acetyltransferase family protein n=1 Tax=Paenibacillus anaericanus TaxID=170367 RepID=A0A3S1BQS5_9BACL|nr:arsinothricin resistance N-acetyltransferase ArsN1 family A [Paenibacillus anaericanus]RUT47459.1 N-acetyltransferase family protein [Paenibacillus anaericanus]